MTDSIDQDSFTIAFERQLAAPPEDVFDAWTRPERIARWWDPDGVPLASCEIDLRVGGAFTFVNAGAHHPFAGTYLTVERPALLVFEAMGSVGTVLIERTGAGTRMRVTIRCGSKEQLQHFVAIGVATNTGRTLDNLVTWLSERREHAPSP